METKNFVVLCATKNVDEIRSKLARMFARCKSSFMDKIINVYSGETITFAFNPHIKDKNGLLRVNNYYEKNGLPKISYMLISPCFSEVGDESNYEKIYRLFLAESEKYGILEFDLWRMVSDYIFIDFATGEIHYLEDINHLSVGRKKS